MFNGNLYPPRTAYDNFKITSIGGVLNEMITTVFSNLHVLRFIHLKALYHRLRSRNGNHRRLTNSRHAQSHSSRSHVVNSYGFLGPYRSSNCTMMPSPGSSNHMMMSSPRPHQHMMMPSPRFSNHMMMPSLCEGIEKLVG